MPGNISKKGKVVSYDCSKYYNLRGIENFPIVEVIGDRVDYDVIYADTAIYTGGIMGSSDEGINTYKFSVESGKTYAVTGSFGREKYALYYTEDTIGNRRTDFDLDLNVELTRLTDYEVTIPEDGKYLYVHCENGSKCKVFVKTNRFEVNEAVLSKELYEKIFEESKEEENTYAFYYGCCDSAPVKESEVEALKTSLDYTISFDKGRYVIACVCEIKRICDRNGLDCTDDFSESRAGMYYCYFYNHTATVPMEFSVWL